MLTASAWAYLQWLRYKQAATEGSRIPRSGEPALSKAENLKNVTGAGVRGCRGKYSPDKPAAYAIYGK